ncbi:MAG: ABC transporter substrate-binding protein [Pseudomonadota bacterium]
MAPFRSYYIACVFFFLAANLSCTAIADTKQFIEVHHWWFSGGEARALETIKKEMSHKGFTWKDSLIKGSDGLQQKRVLRARINSKNPPDIILTQYIPHFAESGFLEPLDDIAKENNWRTLIPDPIQQRLKYKGHWLAVPINIQRFNWVWANKKIFDQLHLKPPQTYEELIEVSKKIKQAGYTPFAHGEQAWQDLIFFESILLSVGGTALYNKALVEFDANVLNGKKMETVFERVLQIRTFFDKDYIGRDWNLATSMIIHNKAAMQVMGDWVKGEFTLAHQSPNKDFLCFAFPDTQDIFLFTSDFFSVIKTSYKHNKEAQYAFVNTIFDKNIQEKFNLAKGSLPARQDTNTASFDDCSQQAKIDFNRALKKKKVIEHMDIRLTEAQRNIIYKPIVNAFSLPNITAKEAAQAFALAALTLKNMQ